MNTELDLQEEIITQLVNHLEQQGVHPQTHVEVAKAITADIVTDLAIYAVRPVLSEKVFRTLVPLIVMMRDAYSPTRLMVIVGRWPDSDEPTAATLAAAKDAGIAVNFWTGISSQIQ